MRPTTRFLSDALIQRILGEARLLLAEVGLIIANDEAVSLLLERGATRKGDRVLLGGSMVNEALESAPPSFSLHGRDGSVRAELGTGGVHFTPGSSAINILDPETGEIRRPTTRDYVRYARLVEELDFIDYQSTAFVPADVPELICDSYRLYLSLIYGTSPVVTGAFTIETLRTMVDMLVAVRGSEPALAEAPLAMFSCCPTAPLKWSDVTSQNVIDCGRYGIPVEFIAMPLTGFVAPGTLVGTLIQHAAETLSGVVLSQVSRDGAPIAWGGSPGIFDYRYETTPLGAIESQMVACGYTEVGKHLGLPTQAYIGLSDAKKLDAQAGFETTSGLFLAALSGVDSISGPGMHDLESCFSLEKLALDNDICASVQRMLRGIEPRDGDFPARPHFEELLTEGHLLIADHTRRWFKKEVHFPSPIITRANLSRYREDGAQTLEERAKDRVEVLLRRPPKLLDEARRQKLDAIMNDVARSAGLSELPAHE